MEKKELCTFLSKAEINVHMGFLSRMGRRQLRQQRIYSCSGHRNGLAFYLRDPISYWLGGLRKICLWPLFVQVHLEWLMTCT